MSAWHLVGDLKMVNREKKKGRNGGRGKLGGGSSKERTEKRSCAVSKK